MATTATTVGDARADDADARGARRAVGTRTHEARAKATVAAVADARGDLCLNLPTYSETLSAGDDDEMALPVSIFEDPLLEEMAFYVETSKRKMEDATMSPTKATRRERADVDDPAPFEDVCERSPLGVPRRRRHLSANGRRTTLLELLSPRRTLAMGERRTSADAERLDGADADSAREDPQIAAQKAISRSQSMDSIARDADVGSAFKAALQSPDVRRPRETLTRQLSRGLSCERLFATGVSSSAGA